MLGCLDTCYYVGIGAVLLVMVLFNVRCSFLQNGFHSLLRYDLRVDMFVNDNETEPAEGQRGWNSLLERADNDASESEKEVTSEPEVTTATPRDRSKSFSMPGPREENSDDDEDLAACSGPRGSGPGGGGSNASRGSFGSRSGVSRRREQNCQKKNNNIIFRHCDLDYDDNLQNSCVQLITNNLVELVNSESFIAQCESIALMDDVLRLDKSLEYDKILGDLSTET